MDGPVDWLEYRRIFVGLLAMLNIAPVTLIFIDMTSGFARADKQRCALVTTLTVFGILSIFAMLGDPVLDAFGVGVDHVRIAGGMILLFFGPRMAGRSASPRPPAGRFSGDPVPIAASPLGMPLLAGCVFLALQFAIFLGLRINATAAVLLNRMMGPIVASIAGGILATGIRNSADLSSAWPEPEPTLSPYQPIL